MFENVLGLSEINIRVFPQVSCNWQIFKQIILFVLFWPQPFDQEQRNPDVYMHKLESQM
jgi:hypothetical protein